MDNIYEITLLLDFYGQLLTKKQYEILDLHYNNDYSLAEIAEHFNISRQGVFDNIKRGKAALYDLEHKLGLVKKFAEQKKTAEEILECLKNIQTDNLDKCTRESINKVKDGILDIIKRF